MKRKLQVEVSKRNIGWQTGAMVTDDSALLRTIHGPVDGIVKDYIENLKEKIVTLLEIADVYLLLDKYYRYSTVLKVWQDRLKTLEQAEFVS